jgi:hypothetical protein
LKDEQVFKDYFTFLKEIGLIRENIDEYFRMLYYDLDDLSRSEFLKLFVNLDIYKSYPIEAGMTEKEWEGIKKKYKDKLSEEKMLDFFIKLRGGKKWIEPQYPKDFIEFDRKYKTREPVIIDYEKLIRDFGYDTGEKKFKELVKTLHPEDMVAIYHGTSKNNIQLFQTEGIDLEVPPTPKQEVFYERHLPTGEIVRDTGLYVSLKKGVAERFAGVGGGVVQMVVKAKHLDGRIFEKYDHLGGMMPSKEAISLMQDPNKTKYIVNMINTDWRRKHPDLYLHSFSPLITDSILMMGGESQAVLKRPIWKDEFKKFKVQFIE